RRKKTTSPPRGLLGTPRHNNPIHHQHFDRSRQHFRVLCIFLSIALTVTATTSSRFKRRLKREEYNNDKHTTRRWACMHHISFGDCTTTEGTIRNCLRSTRTCCMLQTHQAPKELQQQICTNDDAQHIPRQPREHLQPRHAAARHITRSSGRAGIQLFEFSLRLAIR
ncbi:unnamed protein product, partial [Ectocarpus sp. 12 AP-2014]